MNFFPNNNPLANQFIEVVPIGTTRVPPPPILWKPEPNAGPLINNEIVPVKNTTSNINPQPSTIEYQSQWSLLLGFGDDPIATTTIAPVQSTQINQTSTAPTVQATQSYPPISVYNNTMDVQTQNPFPNIESKLNPNIGVFAVTGIIILAILLK